MASNVVRGMGHHREHQSREIVGISMKSKGGGIPYGLQARRHHMVPSLRSDMWSPPRAKKAPRRGAHQRPKPASSHARKWDWADEVKQRASDAAFRADPPPPHIRTQPPCTLWCVLAWVTSLPRRGITDQREVIPARTTTRSLQSALLRFRNSVPSQGFPPSVAIQRPRPSS